MPADYAALLFAPWSPMAADAGELTKQERYLDCTLLTPPSAAEPRREDATWRTAHWRTYERSAWEVQTQDPEKHPLRGGRCVR